MDDDQIDVLPKETEGTKTTEDQPPPPAPPPEEPDDDPDVQELREAEKALAAEQKGQPAQPPAPEAPPPAAPPAGDRVPEAPPKGARKNPWAYVKEAAQAAAKAREQAAYFKGLAEAALAQKNQGQPPEPEPQADPDTLIKQQRAVIAQAAQRYDAGEITMADYEATRGGAEDAIAEVRQAVSQAMIAHANSQSQQSSGIEAIFAESHADQLKAAHPFVAMIEKDEAKFSALVDMAKANAAALGAPFGKGAREDIRLREEIARLSDTFGPQWFPGVKSAPSAKPLEQARAAPPTKAAQLPPSPSALGTTAGATVLTEQQILAMPQEELEEAIRTMPPATLRRLKGY